ncbi:MAG: thioredoxin domain-containing protein [Dehalococcoidia bacterium]
MQNQPREGNPAASPGTVAIEWLSWNQETFERAQQQDRPVLLSISAVWCYWCQVMDRDTFTDSDVVDYINQHFVAVRVDNDRRPDINARYNVGGWPTTAFLTPHGGYIAGATYLPPDQLLAMLLEIHRAYQEDKAQLYDQAMHLQRQRQDQVNRVAAGAELEQRLVDRIGRRVTSAYDVRNGGFGEDLKFPSAPVLQFLLHLYRTTREDFYRVMVEKSLDGMARGGLYDSAEGGFFRYSAQPDWSEAQHEKMLEDNINLARVYLDAHILLDKPEYREIAGRTLDYLLSSLYDGEAQGFRGSQGAHSDYFGLPDAERQRQPAPPVDPVCYTSWSALAVSFLLEARWKLPRPELAGVAFSVLDRLLEMAKGGSLFRAFDRNGPVTGSSVNLLGDWAHLLNALLEGYGADPSRSDYLSAAERAAAYIMENFYDEAKGGFFDIARESEAIGYLRVREKPLPENVAVVLGVLKLQYSIPNPSYHQAVEQTLSAYVEANRDYGEFACTYGLAVDLFLKEPVEITVEGAAQEDSTQEMNRAAVRVPYPHLLVRALSGNESDGIAQAHVCVNTLCLPPVSEPAELESSVAEAVNTQATPIENIFERFTGF